MHFSYYVIHYHGGQHRRRNIILENHQTLQQVKILTIYKSCNSHLIKHNWSVYFNTTITFVFRTILNEKLSSSFAKQTRNRHKQICQVNIKVNVIVWLVEASSGVIMSLDFLIIGSRSNAITGLLRVFTMLSFFVLIPCTYLINCSEGVNIIVDKGWQVALGRLFKPNKETDDALSIKNQAKEPKN